MTTSLDAKEELYELQQVLLQTATVVVQVGLNMPGGHLLYPWGELFKGALEEVRQVLYTIPDVLTVQEQELYTTIGPYCLFAVRADGYSVKEHMVSLEEQTPWGRLWDIDVLTATGSIDRGALGLEPRRCLICSEAAHVCRKLGKHSKDQVIAAAHKVIALGTQNE